MKSGQWPYVSDTTSQRTIQAELHQGGMRLSESAEWAWGLDPPEVIHAHLPQLSHQYQQEEGRVQDDDDLEEGRKEGPVEKDRCQESP